MQGDADLAAVGAAIGDRARAQMLSALLDGRALTATELARVAQIAPSTATAHLERLTHAGLIATERQGRHRYVRLANAEVAHAVEALATIAPARPVTTLRAGSASDAERAARSCYDHLAGSLGVAITDRLCALGALDRDDLHLRDPSALARLGVDVDALAAGAGRRPLTRPCLDWSERRHHLAGRAGAGLLDALLAQDWLRRRAGSRALTTTGRGRAALREVLGLEL